MSGQRAGFIVEFDFAEDQVAKVMQPRIGHARGQTGQIARPAPAPFNERNDEKEREQNVIEDLVGLQAE